MSGGRSTLDGRDFVARFGQWRDDFEKDAAATASVGPDLPIPRVLGIGEAFDGAYAISERNFGVFLEELADAGFRVVLPALLGVIDGARPHARRRRDLRRQRMARTTSRPSVSA